MNCLMSSFSVDYQHKFTKNCQIMVLGTAIDSINTKWNISLLYECAVGSTYIRFIASLLRLVLNKAKVLVFVGGTDRANVSLKHISC